MDKKICLKCSTENEGNYVFCKYCGAMLPVADKLYSYPLEEEQEFKEVEEPDIDGISLNEMNTYIGSRPHRFIPKFLRMQTTGQTTSFCLPVLLFGMFFGFFGTAVWFFWRKMSKLGWLFVGIGLFLAAADIIINYDALTAYFDGLFSIFENIMQNPQKYSDRTLISNAFNTLLLSFEENLNPIISLISQYIGRYMVPAVTSVFAMWIYKNKAVSDIKRIKNTCDDVALRRQLIAKKGGCSGLLIMIPIFANILANAGVILVCII